MKIPLLPQALEIGLQLNQGDRDDSVLHATDLAHTLPGEGCPRQLWLKLRGADKRELTAGQLLMFFHGNRIHEDVAKLLKAGLPAEWEITNTEHSMELDGIVGTCDAMMINRTTGDGLVVDFKTLRGKAFGFLNAEGKPKPAHALQVQTYIYLLAKSLVFCADGGMVLYVDREGQNASVQFFVKHDDNAVKEAIEAAKAIRDGGEPPILDARLDISKNKGPDSVRLKMPWQCDYCGYRDISCPAALPYDYRNLGIVAKVDGDTLICADNVPAEVAGIVEGLLELQVMPF